MEKKQQASVWREQLARYKQSGLSRNEFCRRNNLKIHQLQYWVERLRELDCRGGRFVQVSGETSSVELHIGSQIKLVVKEGYDAALVKSLVELLRDAET